MDLLTFRDTLFRRLPRWLRGFWGARLIYSIVLIVDALGAAAKKALVARFPGFDSTAIPLLCHDRQMRRGPNETDEQIVARLLGWLESKRLLGHPMGQIGQLVAYSTPFVPHFRVVFANGRYWDWNAGTTTISQMAWNWDGLNLPARFWVLWYMPESWTDDGTFIDDGFVDDGGCLGIGPVEDQYTGTVYGTVQGIADLIKSQGSGNIRHMGTVLIWNESDWEAQLPDGTWDVMSKRNPNCEYLAGDRVYQ